MPCLGIVGTLVVDRIHPPPDPAGGESPVIDDWGGIAYSLEAFEAAREDDWTFLPIVNVGSDVHADALSRIETLEGVAGLDGLRRVPEPNNRVELFYHDARDRCEHLTGGVPGWTWADLEPHAGRCDALYVNFIAGWELDLAAARALRRGFAGPIYCDIHSMLLDVDDTGVRVRRSSFPEWAEWSECFDWLQGNEAEVRVVTGTDDPLDGVRRLVDGGAAAAFVTLGGAGAAWAEEAAGSGLAGLDVLSQGAAPKSTPVDPTGCGDVWGATCVATMLAGRSAEAAARRANRFGARKASHRGSAGLSRALGQLAHADGTTR